MTPAIDSRETAVDRLIDHIGAGSSVIVPVANGEPVGILDALERRAAAGLC